ncbi:MAG TPA: VCBS repeat-containing protein [Candidatus Polarisedimenticolia bacterium]|nr:VCBS repeat-containing protein [Candidatus Polarisedimenticolia bacterium]
MPPWPNPRRHAPVDLTGRLGVFIFLAAASMAASLSGGSLRQTPPAAPGFPIPIPRTTDYRGLWGSTLAVDLDRDGRSELLASVPSGVLFLIDRGGTAVPGWPRSVSDLPAPASLVGQPGVGDLDGDGTDEVVACVNAGAAPRRAFLVAWSRDGNRVTGWPVEIPTLDPYAGCSPGGTLVADLDADGRAEVAQAVSPSEIWLYDGDGRPLSGWPFRPPLREWGIAPRINARLATADLDGDGRREILAVESGLGPLLHALTLQGGEAAFFPRPLDEIVDTQAPAAGDLDADGVDEVVQATLPVSNEASGEPAPMIPGALHSLRRDGVEAEGWPVPLSSGAMWGAMLLDLDGDGRPEVLQGDGDTLHAFDATGKTLQGFPLTMRRLFTRATVRLDSRWVAGDLDSDRSPDFLRALGRMDGDVVELRVAAIRSRTGSPVAGTPWTIEGLFPASDPVLVDLTGDGAPEVAMLAAEGGGGGWRLMAWDVAAGRNGRGAGIRTDRQRVGVSLPGPIPR